MPEAQISPDVPLDLTKAEMPPVSMSEWLPDIRELLALSAPRDGKIRHGQVNKLVWAFRKEFNYDTNQENGGPDYQNTLAHFELASHTLNSELRSTINQFASPDHYREVRGCYRMRASRMVSEAELVKLSREVNAALIWRELI